MPGIQSTNLMCTSEPLRGLCEKDATSIRKKNPAANYRVVSCVLTWDWPRAGCVGTYQSAGDIDAAVADSRVIEPFWLGETEETVA